MLSVFVSAGLPLAFYPTYRATTGITDAGLAGASAAYLLMLSTTLVLLGRASDSMGRRTVTMGALTLAVAANVVVADTSGVWHLVAGRGLQGVASGLAASATAAWVVGSAPRRPAWAGAVVAGGVPMLGPTLGAVGGALVLEHARVGSAVPFVAAVAMLLLSAVLVAVSGESPPVGIRPRWARPGLAVPLHARPVLLACGAAMFATWAVGGFYQSFAAAVAHDRLGTGNSLLVACLFASFVASNAAGGPLVGAFEPVRVMRWAAIAFTVGTVAVTLSIWAGSVVLVFTASVAAGLCAGAAYTCALRELLARTSAKDRSAVLSAVYLISCAGGAMPGLVAGTASAWVGVTALAAGYAALTAAAAAVIVLQTRGAWPEAVGRDQHQRSGSALDSSPLDL